MLRVGIVGWRGMVGSVLVQRMREERDFDHFEPVFFSTSQAGGKGPSIGKDAAPANEGKELATPKVQPVIYFFQGGHYTKEEDFRILDPRRVLTYRRALAAGPR